MMINQLDLLTQDLLHQIEFKNYNVCDGYKLYKELQEVRLERRRLKDENQVIHSAYEFISKDKKLISQLGNIQGVMKKIEEGQQNRVYKPRIKTELEIVETKK